MVVGPGSSAQFGGRRQPRGMSSALRSPPDKGPVRASPDPVARLIGSSRARRGLPCDMSRRWRRREAVGE